MTVNSKHCGNCNRLAISKMTEYGIKHECEPCNWWSWGNKPLVDSETHEARRKAHLAFDNIWKKGKVPRSSAYRLLARELDLPLRQAHMAVMDKSVARLVPAAANSIMKRLRKV